MYTLIDVAGMLSYESELIREGNLIPEQSLAYHPRRERLRNGLTIGLVVSTGMVDRKA